jgi:TrmH family RNA methyltransferase
MITKNQIKLIRSLGLKKNRIKHNLFIAEGEKIVKELLDSNLTLYHLFSTNDAYDLKENYTIIKNEELKQISNLKTPNKVVALFKIPRPANIDFNKNIIALEEINDPGNLGTIIRLCDWFGISDIICSENSVDCFNPKTIQASMGSIYRVNVTYQSFDDLYVNKKYNLIAADLEGEKINDYNFNKNQIIFFGSESNGFSNNLSLKITEKITIPRYNKNIDSLNVANSVAIVLSELKHKTTEK